MAPLVPHWTRPSHPDIQEVIINEAEFTSKSLSKVALPPFSFYAKMAFPPCTMAEEPSYATVQIGRNKHLNLNSDLLYINHSCEPSLFFYPSTEWDMAQPFDCLCGAPTCRRQVGGAKHMADAQLQGVWLNGHIHELLRERKAAAGNRDGPLSGTHPASVSENGTAGAVSLPDPDPTDPTAHALKGALEEAERVVVSVRAALSSYAKAGGAQGAGGASLENGHYANDSLGLLNGSQRRGATSRELSGEMGGDTVCV